MHICTCEVGMSLFSLHREVHLCVRGKQEVCSLRSSEDHQYLMLTVKCTVGGGGGRQDDSADFFPLFS